MLFKKNQNTVLKCANDSAEQVSSSPLLIDKCKEVTMFTKGYTALSLLDSPQNVNGVTLFLR